MHECGVAHEDLSHKNVISCKGIAVIIDFSFARPVDEAAIEGDGFGFVLSILCFRQGPGSLIRHLSIVGMLSELDISWDDENRWLERISRTDPTYAMLPPPSYPKKLAKPIGVYPAIVESWNRPLDRDRLISGSD